MKDFADDKLNSTPKLNFVLRRVENILRKGENAGYQHFLLYPQCFQKLCFSGLCVERVNHVDCSHLTNTFQFLCNFSYVGYMDLLLYPNDKINVTAMMKFAYDRIKNIQNNQKSLVVSIPFSTMFSKSVFLGVAKSLDFVMQH